MTFMPHFVPTIKRIMAEAECEERVARAAFELYRDNIEAAIDWATLFAMEEATAKSNRTPAHV